MGSPHVALDSGHGSQVKSTEGDEVDGFDESASSLWYSAVGGIILTKLQLYSLWTISELGTSSIT